MQQIHTLGDVLYAGKAGAARAAEEDWVRLVHQVAAGEVPALYALYDRAHRVVFTLILRIISNRASAEELTLDVFHGLWRRASGYDPSRGTVLGWIMNQARARAIERLRADRQKKRQEHDADSALVPIDLPDYLDLMALKERSRMLRNALDALTPDERQTIEAAFFAGRVGSRIRPALHKLRHALGREAPKTASAPIDNQCEQAELVSVYALRALPEADARKVEGHLVGCSSCRREVAALRPVLEAFVAWPTDVLRPITPLRPRLAQRIAAETGGRPVVLHVSEWVEPEWEGVAPGISVKMLATDAGSHMVSMLVRLVPGGEYPPHTHAGVEELHLLDGELWIDDRKLYAGDYNRAEPGTGDKRVWSETGCTCVLVTSARDRLR